MTRPFGIPNRIVLSIITLLFFSSCTELDYQMLEWMTGYMTDGQQSTGTSLKLTVRDGDTGVFVSGALIQVAGRDNNILRQVQTNTSGVAKVTNLTPAVYIIRAWKGRKWAEDTIYISNAVSALMIIR